MLLRSLIEVFFSISLVANSLLFIPQVVKLLKAKNAKNVSLVTFAGFCLIQLSMVLHAYIGRDYLMLLGVLLSLIACGTVTVLIVYYNYIKG